MDKKTGVNTADITKQFVGQQAKNVKDNVYNYSEA